MYVYMYICMYVCAGYRRSTQIQRVFVVLIIMIWGFPVSGLKNGVGDLQCRIRTCTQDT